MNNIKSGLIAFAT